MNKSKKKFHMFGHGLTSLLDVSVLLKRFFSLLKKPAFWLLTIWGNVFVVGSAVLLYHFERDVNPLANDFLNCLIWSVGLVTTAGASQIEPITAHGKILMICVMVAGAVFLWTYMALFIGALIDPELQTLEQEMRDMQKAQQDISQGPPSAV